VETRQSRCRNDKLSPKKSKRGALAKPVTTVLLPEILDYLRSRWQSSSNSSDFIFPTLATQRVGRKTGLSRQFMNLIKTAGIPNEPIRANVTGKGRKFYPDASGSILDIKHRKALSQNLI
jgi:hypothetical protein